MWLQPCVYGCARLLSADMRGCAQRDLKVVHGCARLSTSGKSTYQKVVLVKFLLKGTMRRKRPPLNSRPTQKMLAAHKAKHYELQVLQCPPISTALGLPTRRSLLLLLLRTWFSAFFTHIANISKKRVF